MTASAAKRQRLTSVGAVAVVVATMVALGVAVVAVVTLRSSREGRAPDADNRVLVSFPATPNAVIGVVDDLDRLTSLAVLTLHPSGVGGSILVVPVNVDTTNGFGPERQPISRQPFAPDDEVQADELRSQLEPLLTLSIERSLIVGPTELAELLDPLAPIQVDLPQRVVDSDTPGTGFVAAAGTQGLTTEELVAAFTAISAEGVSYDHHEVDVALWAGVAGVGDASRSFDLPLDDLARPVPPASALDLLDRLLAGPAAARDLGINASGALTAENPDETDFVLADRRDALLVFGAISPSLVSKPNEALAFKLVVGFDDEQISTLGTEADGTTVTKESMTLRFIGELLFGQANIVAVDLADAPEAVPTRTQLYVADESFVEDVRAVSARFFGEADVVVATEITDGADVVVVLGTDFLAARAELMSSDRAAGQSGDGNDGVADFDVTADTEAPPPTSAAGDTGSATSVTSVTSDTSAPADTVQADG